MKDGKYVILCIDDDKDILEALRMILEKNDYVMVEAESAEEGLKVFKTESPDFILVDLMMEEIDSGRNLPIFLRKSPEEADRELMYRALFEIKKDLVELKDLVVHQHHESYKKNNIEEEKTLSLDELEREAIIAALNKTRGSKRKAAKLLNISERTLYRKIKQYNLQ